MSDEESRYLAGEDGVDLDPVTRAELDALGGLLADPAVWATADPGLEDAVVAAIAQEAQRPTRRVAPDVAAQPTPPTPLAAARAERAPRSRRVLLLAAAALVGVLAVGALALGRVGDDDGDVTAVALEPTDLFPDATGRATVEQTASGWRIELDADGLLRLDDGRYYQAWLRRDDGVLVPIGTFNEPVEVVLWAGVSPRDYPTLTVTVERDDDDQASSGERVLVGEITLDE